MPGTINIGQFIVSIPLFFVLFFGLSFILNMLIKTTWFPVVAYLALVGGVYLYVGKLTLVDMVILFFGLLGAVTGGWAIRTLRRKGYRMF
ncbi:YuiB family protein [Calditerricola yamamurae]